VIAGINLHTGDFGIDRQYQVRSSGRIAMNLHEPGNALTPTGLVSEVREFREAVANPARSADEIRRAYGLIVDHAGHLNPHDPGFEWAGVALKEAVCMWLDCQTLPRH
jgi:hypothetical protein